MCRHDRLIFVCSHARLIESLCDECITPLIIELCPRYSMRTLTVHGACSNDGLYCSNSPHGTLRDRINSILDTLQVQEYFAVPAARYVTFDQWLPHSLVFRLRHGQSNDNNPWTNCIFSRRHLQILQQADRVVHSLRQIEQRFQYPHYLAMTMVNPSLPIKTFMSTQGDVTGTPAILGAFVHSHNPPHHLLEEGTHQEDTQAGAEREHPLLSLGGSPSTRHPQSLLLHLPSDSKYTTVSLPNTTADPAHLSPQKNTSVAAPCTPQKKRRTSQAFTIPTKKTPTHCFETPTRALPSPSTIFDTPTKTPGSIRSVDFRDYIAKRQARTNSSPKHRRKPYHGPAHLASKSQAHQKSPQRSSTAEHDSPQRPYYEHDYPYTSPGKFFASSLYNSETARVLQYHRSLCVSGASGRVGQLLDPTTEKTWDVSRTSTPKQKLNLDVSFTQDDDVAAAAEMRGLRDGEGFLEPRPESLDSSPLSSLPDSDSYDFDMSNMDW
ncbi:hypothetical protein ANO11243_065380 [Dothideomycetidae sp. 11243]|nr:hypothetical protein ANO11243_065380 [fungal sp. No.11243]